MNIDIYTGNGEKKTTKALKKEIFEVSVNEGLVHRAVVLRQANSRNAIAHTKTRAELAKTTKKMFRQKGTGRARRGAATTNLLRGGGVTHGPRSTRNFTKNMTKKERRLALFSTLTLKAQEKEIFGLESFDHTEPKTKTFAELLQKLPTAQKYLFVLSKKDLVFEKSAANIPHVRTILASYINPTDVLKAEKLCFVSDALETVEKTFLNASQ